MRKFLTKAVAEEEGILHRDNSGKAKMPTKIWRTERNSLGVERRGAATLPHQMSLNALAGGLQITF